MKNSKFSSANFIIYDLPLLPLFSFDFTHFEKWHAVTRDDDFFTEMGYKYAVHRNYNFEWMTKEDPCRCSSPQSGISIFNMDEEPTVHQMEYLSSYNKTMNGTIFSASDVDWNHLKKSQCEAWVIYLYE